MSDAPERIWAWGYGKSRWEPQSMEEWYTGGIGLVHEKTEYVRADIPPTLEQALQCPEVQALIDATKAARLMLDQGCAAPLTMDRWADRIDEGLQSALAPFTRE